MNMYCLLFYYFALVVFITELWIVTALTIFHSLNIYLYDEFYLYVESFVLKNFGQIAEWNQFPVVEKWIAVVKKLDGL